MAYIMLVNLQVVLFFVCPIVENFKKVFICRLTMSNIVVYRTTIIPNTLNKVANCIEVRVVKGWSTYLGVDWPVMLQ